MNAAPSGRRLNSRGSAFQVQQVSVNGTSSVLCCGREFNPFHASRRTEQR
jgi:hypothetical protein